MGQISICFLLFEDEVKDQLQKVFLSMRFAIKCMWMSRHPAVSEQIWKSWLATQGAWGVKVTRQLVKDARKWSMSLKANHRTCSPGMQKPGHSSTYTQKHANTHTHALPATLYRDFFSPLKNMICWKSVWFCSWMFDFHWNKFNPPKTLRNINVRVEVINGVIPILIKLHWHELMLYDVTCNGADTVKALLARILHIDLFYVE